MHGTQRRVIDLLVEQSVSRTTYDKQLSVSLYELLVPNALKGRTENVVLLLDRESAQYPWELMTDRTRPNEPLLTRLGLMRQFRTTEFRANPRPSRGNYAMVIGDPINTGLVALQGAQEEAEAVVKWLRAGGYVVQDAIRKDSKRIINDLFADEYQILHIAAHGAYDPTDPDSSGVVLGGGIFLTAKEMVNLRTVPDLVFINCCHLAKVDREQNGRLETEFPNRLAASVAEELIKMGVKAVVAAGWAVEDEAAKHFAGGFYQKMLEGEAFGEAVKQARKATHMEFPGTNTWGAYQCYGNPNFRLNLQGGRRVTRTGFYSRREYRDELRSIAERPSVQDEKGNEWARARLIELDEDMKKQPSSADFLTDGEVLADFGDAWTSLGDYSKASDYYRRSLHTKDAKVPLRAVERLVSVNCRQAMQLWEAHRVGKVDSNSRATIDDERRKEVLKVITEAKEITDWLIKFSATPKRYSMVGKVYECLALFSEEQQHLVDNLKSAEEFYHKAYEAARDKRGSPRDWVFPAIHHIACAVFSPKADIARLTTLIEEAQQALSGSKDEDGGFRARVLKPDLDILMGLAKGDLPTRQQKVIEGYEHAFATRVKPNDAFSAFSRINFLIEMLAAGDNADKASLVKALGKIRNEVLKLRGGNSRSKKDEDE